MVLRCACHHHLGRNYNDAIIKETEMRRRELLAGAGAIALALPMAACGGKVVGVDPGTIDIIGAITNAVRGLCGILPTVDTISKFIVAMALPVALPVQQAASIVAKELCDKIQPLVAGSQGLRKAEATTGKTVIDYGIVYVNGKPVRVQVYAQ